MESVRIVLILKLIANLVVLQPVMRTASKLDFVMADVYVMSLVEKSAAVKIFVEAIPALSLMNQ